MDLDILHVAVPGKPRADLAGAASKIFGCLGVADFEERESSNYPTGAYLAGAKDSAKFEVSLPSTSCNPQPRRLTFSRATIVLG